MGADMVKIRLGTAVVVIGSLIVLPAVAMATGSKLTVTGKVTGAAGQNLSVMLVANSGASVRVSTDASGKFTAKVPAGTASSFVVSSPGKGPTLHILSGGKYAGPVVLGKKNSTTGYTRLSTKKGGTLSVGMIAMKTGYSVSTAKNAVIDSKGTIRMNASKPVSSGSVREAALVGPVVSFGALTADSAALGADADKDGLPNFADADANGDGVMDAAQPTNAIPFTGATATTTLDTRPTWAFEFRKIIRASTQAPINSNLVPAVTADQIGTFLSSGLQLEIAGNLTDAQQATGAVSMVCQVSYCQPGAVSTLVSSSNPALQGKTVDSVRNPDGTLALQRTSPATRFALVFKPGDAVKGTNALTGDAFGFVTTVGGVEVANEVRVLTSSVVSPAAFATAGDRTFGAEVQTSISVKPTAGQMSAFPVTFFRPQDLAPNSTSQLVDRGGLRYRFVVFTDMGMHVCRPSMMSNLSATLRKPVDENSTDSQKAYIFDSEQMPKVNGTRLGVTLDLNACFTAGPGTDPKPAAGTGFNLWVETYDADGNESGAAIRILTPAP